MTPDDIDRILAEGEQLVPSTAFELSVMEAVRQEATAPPRLAFPWRRAVPGFSALLGALAAALWHSTRMLDDPRATELFDGQIRALLAFAARGELQWIALAVVATIVSIVLPLRLMRAGV